MTNFGKQIIESTIKGIQRAAEKATKTPAIAGKVTKVTVAASAAQDLLSAVMALPTQFDGTIPFVENGIATSYLESAEPLTVLSIMWELSGSATADMQVEAIA